MSRELIDQIRAELAKAEARPGIAKAERSFRDRHRCRAHAAFRAGVDELESEGWSRRRIAQAIEVDPVTLKDWYEQGDRKRSQIPAWALDAIESLSPGACAAVMRAKLAYLPPSGRTGTDG